MMSRGTLARRRPPPGPRAVRWIAGVILLVTMAFPAEAFAREQKQVLVLYATRRDAQIAVLGDRELPRLLEQGLGETIDYYAEYLDLARFPEEGYQAAVRNFLREKYRDQRFDLVIAMHDIALQFAARYRDEIFAGVPIIFTSMSSNTRRLPNSTGMSATPDFGGSLVLVSALQPNVRRVVVVSGADRRDAEMERQVRDQFQPFEKHYEFTYFRGLPTRELQSRLRALPADAVVYYVLVNRDGTGEAFHPLEYLERVIAASSVPVYSWVDSAMGRGIVGGSLRSQAKQIDLVGGLALRVLRGESADSVPLATSNVNTARIDWRQLERWGIDSSRVPSWATVLYREPSIWDRYRPYIIVAIALFLAQTMLIAALLVQRQRRRRAEEQTSKSEAELKQSYDQIRYLAGRLLGAQESERARIARELHDDVSQQLALLSIDLELLNAGAAPGQHALVRESLDRAQHVARTVHDLSHRLHPAKLRLIGLVSALQSLQREMTKSGLEVTFLHKNLPAHLSEDLTLCLYRVVQEALQNAHKHSEASEVSIDLIGTPARLELTIADDGVGFDPGAALSTGLGLISMRERVEAVGGSLRIDANPAQGTRLHISIPLRGAVDGADEPVLDTPLEIAIPAVQQPHPRADSA
jgi:signal transduction histidine kinase